MQIKHCSKIRRFEIHHNLTTVPNALHIFLLLRVFLFLISKRIVMKRRSQRRVGTLTLIFTLGTVAKLWSILKQLIFKRCLIYR